MRAVLWNQFAKWTGQRARIDDEGGRNEQKNEERPTGGREGRGKDAKKCKIGRGGGHEGVNTWPHPDFTHTTTRAEEETERWSCFASSDRACTRETRCGHD